SGVVGGSSAATGGQATGGPGRPQGTGNNASTEVGESPIYNPIPGSDPAERIQARGDVDPSGEQSVTGRQLGPGAGGDALVPYREIYPEYSNRAARAVEQMPVPASLRTFVRSYFESLAPGGNGG
ncbi:MAG TPA: hypothetical protein VM754_07445, partial [Actinomycetota bacterium]|nr:hypothetical protein [Actinomycetota bacterium]